MKKQIKQNKKIINTDPRSLLAVGLIGLKTIVPIGGIAAALFSSCDNDTVPTCKCPNGTEHDAACGCGTTDCRCSYNTKFNTLAWVEFYRSSLANATKADDIFDLIDDAYFNGWNTTEKGNFTTRVTKIYIKAGLGIGITEGTILNIGCDETLGNIEAYFNNHIISYNSLKNGIRLAGNYNNAREIVGQAFGKYRSGIARS